MKKELTKQGILKREFRAQLSKHCRYCIAPDGNVRWKELEDGVIELSERYANKLKKLKP